MKPVLFLLLLSPPILAQSIQNPGFETPRDTIRALPAGWKVDTQAGYTIVLDSTVAKSGRQSLRIAQVPDAVVSQAGFSQSAPVQLSTPTLVHLRGFVKTDNPAGVGVWWNAWQDKQHKGFAHSSQQASLRQTNDWQPLDLVLPTSSEVNQFTFGAYLRGQGHVWFDDLRFDPVPVSAQEPSPTVKSYLTKAISLVKKHALVSDSIPWPQTQAKLLMFARGMQTESETYPIIGHLLNQLRTYGDNHSFFLSPIQVKDLKADQSTDEKAEPKARYLGEGIGYILVPRFMGINTGRETAFATHIQTLIRQIDSTQTVTSWVIDLRGNTGGNVFPMLAGLLPLYGKNAKGPYKRVTKVQQPYKLRKAPGRIAILLDGQTASSGEFTALSFIGLPNVRSFGTHSASYTTGNADYTLPDGAMLFIAGKVGKDRAGKSYPHGITPDEEITAPTTDTTDPTLEAAKAWLTKK